MFLIPCRLLFEGGPHDGFFVDWEYIPDQRLIVPADSRWREIATDQGSKFPRGLTAIYIWRNTQIVGQTDDPEIMLRYRFLSYHAHASAVAVPRGRKWRLFLSPWRRLVAWIGPRGPESESSDRELPARITQPGAYSAARQHD